MKLVRRLIYFSAAFVLVFGALFASFHQMGLFEVKTIPVEISAQAEERAASPVEAGLRGRVERMVRSFRGKRIWEIDITDVRASIARDEWVKDVMISRAFPNEIRVRVKPKNAVMLLVGKKGEFLPVTDDGGLLSALPAGQLPDLPILRGERFLNEVSRRQETIGFLLALPERGPLSKRNISEIAWAQEDGYTLTLLQPKVEVKLGDERLELKSLRVAQVVNYLNANNLRGRVIDASFSKKVLVRLRKGP